MATLLGSGLLLLVTLGIAFSALLLLVAQWVPVDRLFLRLPATHVQETRQALTTFALLFGVALPFQGLQRIYQGFQQAYLTHTASAALSIVSLGVLYFSPPATLTMPFIVAWAYGLPALAPLVFLPTFWSQRLRGHPFQWSGAIAQSRQLLRSGSLYLLLQIGYVLGWSIDGSLSSAMLGAGSAGLLAVVQRLFQLVTVPLGLLNAPLWAAYADAVARDDRPFLRSTLRKSLLFTAVTASLASGGLVLFHEQVAGLWFGRQMVIPVSLVALAAVMAILEATGNSFAMYLNGLHILRPQLIVAGSFVLISIPMKYALIRFQGLEGLIASTIACYCLCVVIPYLTFFRREAFFAVSSEPAHAKP